MANTYVYNMTDVWANASQQFAAIAMNVTDTASLANSHLIKLQVGSSNRFAVDKTGNVVTASFFGNGTVFAPTLSSNNTISVTNSTSSVVVNTSVVAMGNVASSNTVLSPSSLVFSNSTSTAVLNVSTVALGNSTANSTLSTSQLSVANSTVSVSITNPATLRFANATSTAIVNVSTVAMGNLTANSVLTTNSFAVQNSTASVQVVNPANLFVSTNTGFNLGTSTKAANGSSYLPNGLLANWGWVSANTSTGTITFTTAYSTACYVVTLTPALQASNNAYLTAAPTTTTASVRNQSTGTGSNVYYFALGV